ncbi:MAG: hypothetical protein ABW173_00495 [Sphingomonas sp.]
MADDMQRSSGAPEAERRRDGGGERGVLPGSEGSRGNAAPANEGAGKGVGDETWRPGEDRTGIRPGSPAAEAIAGAAPADAPAEPDNDPQGRTGDDPQPASSQPRPTTGADAPKHGTS